MALLRRSMLTVLTIVLLCIVLFWLNARSSSIASGYSYPLSKPASVPEAASNSDPATLEHIAQTPLITPENDPFRPGIPKPDGNYSRILVVARTTTEDVSWISDELPDLDTAIYVMDDPTAPLHPPKNKGRESTAYLTYIIDHYDALPDVVLFFHAHKFGWHNILLFGQNAAEMLKHLRSERVWRVGYFPARCDHKPGCPDWLHLDRPAIDFDENIRMEEKHYTPEIWRQLHPPGLGGMGESHRTPGVLSAPCCAQFGVSRDRIRANPREMYEHYRDWLLKTDLDDQYAGRVMEYTWHYLFTRNYQHCPSEHTCYCDGYGVCFGSQKEWEVYKEKEAHRWELWDVLGQKDIDPVKEKESRDELALLEEVMGQMKEAALKRGESEKARRTERERVPLY